MLTGAEGAHRTGSTSQLSPRGQWPCCSPPLLCPSLPTASHHTDSREQMPTNSPGASCAPTSFLSPPPSLPHPHRPPPHCSCNSQGLVLPQGLCMDCPVCLDHHPGFPYGLVPPVTLISLKSPLMSTGGVLFLLQWTAGPRVSAWQLCLYAQQGTWHVVGKYWLTRWMRLICSGGTRGHLGTRPQGGPRMEARSAEGYAYTTPSMWQWFRACYMCAPLTT